MTLEARASLYLIAHNKLLKHSDIYGDTFKEAAAIIADQAKEITTLELAEEALLNKLGDNCCACSVDKITHICVAHQPRVDELEAKVARLEKAITPAKLEGLLDFIENEPELDVDGWTNVAEYCAENGIPYKGTNGECEAHKKIQQELEEK